MLNYRKDEEASALLRSWARREGLLCENLSFRVTSYHSKGKLGWKMPTLHWIIPLLGEGKLIRVEVWIGDNGRDKLLQTRIWVCQQ